MNKKANGILCGILFVTLFLSACKSSQIISNTGEAVETDEQGLIVFDEEETVEELENSDDEVEKRNIVGISFSNSVTGNAVSSEARLLRKSLLDRGYTIKGLDNENKLETQVSQIKTMIQSGVDALIIQPVDVYGLSETLQLAEEAEIPVFSYRDLIMESNSVNYLITFNYRTIGQSVAEKIATDFDLKNKKDGDAAVTIEFLMDDPQNLNELFYFNGLMEGLQSYIDSGVLQVTSGKMIMDEVSVYNQGMLSTRLIENRMKEMKDSGSYPDIICCESDFVCQKVIAHLQKAGKIPATLGWPYITGLGCAKESVKDIASKKQKFSLFLDERLLVEECANNLDKYLSDAELEVVDYGTFDNGVRIVGAMLGQVQIIDEDNYPILIDNGYFSEEDFE